MDLALFGKEMGNNQGSLGSEAAQFTTVKTVVILLCFLPLGLQKGVDKEFFLLFTVLDENKSWRAMPIKQLLCWIPDCSQRMPRVFKTLIGCMVWGVLLP